MTNTAISLIITVLNEKRTVQALLAALAKQTVLPHETVIADGGSSDGTYELLQSLKVSYPAINLKIIQVKGNRSRGRNEAIKQAKHKLIAITDAGCIPHPDWLQMLRQKVTEYQFKNQIIKGLVVAGYYDARPKTSFEEAVVPYVLVMPEKVDPHNFLPATRSMLMHKHVWEIVGGFDERLSDNEDFDFAKRIQQQAVEQNKSGYEFPIEIIFTDKAKVTWIPRSDLASFGYMIFRFARGDAQAGIWRTKVALVFARYVAGIAVLLSSLVLNYWLMGGGVIALLGVYMLWSILKNFRYTPRGWYWLPVLQIVADIEVMRGTVAGLLRRK